MLEIERIEKLSAADIKALLMYDDLIVTAGRDGKVRMSDREFSKHAEAMPEKGYINSLAVCSGFLFAGCQDGTIAMYKIDGNKCLDDGASSSALQIRGFLHGHTSNVCSLDVLGSLMLSSSWDFTVKVWGLDFEGGDRSKLVLSVDHPAAVWSAKFVKEGVFVTGCADKLLRFYSDGRLISTLSCHLACVRSIVASRDSIISVDNEGIVIKASLDGKLLRHYSTRDVMYNLSIFAEENGNTEIVCCGEGGQVVVLDENLKLLSRVSVPTTSCWGCVKSSGRMYVGGSDGRIYVYSQEGSDEASKALESIKNERMEPLRDGEFISGDRKFKAVDGDVYQEENGEWIFLGKGEGIKPCDNTFQVELDGRYYTLSFNNDENVYEVAERFINSNKLSDEFKDDIVDFIKKNFGSGEKLRIHDTINVEGVKSVLKRSQGDGRVQEEYPHVLRNLGKPVTADNDEVEKELSTMLVNGPVFVALDLLRYFVAHGYSFDFSFMFRFVPKDKKESITFVRLINNLFVDPPFNLDVFHPYILELKDCGAVNGEVLDDYFTNRSLSNRT